MKAVNLLDEVNAVEKLYVYEKIGRLNGNVLSVVNVENRTLDFHFHENSDELFYVIEGEFKLETEEGLIPVKSGEFVIVPKGTKHCPHCDDADKVPDDRDGRNAQQGKQRRSVRGLRLPCR